MRIFNFLEIFLPRCRKCDSFDSRWPSLLKYSWAFLQIIQPEKLSSYPSIGGYERSEFFLRPFDIRFDVQPAIITWLTAVGNDFWSISVTCSVSSTNCLSMLREKSWGGENSSRLSRWNSGSGKFVPTPVSNLRILEIHPFYVLVDYS